MPLWLLMKRSSDFTRTKSHQRRHFSFICRAQRALTFFVCVCTSITRGISVWNTCCGQAGVFALCSHTHKSKSRKMNASAPSCQNVQAAMERLLAGLDDDSVAIARDVKSFCSSAKSTFAGCKGCGAGLEHTRVLKRQQTRSADEGMTTFHACTKCDSRWRSG